MGPKLAEAAFLNINKPKGITSHDVVSRVRKLSGIKQVGHAGTLDPMAEGVVTIALGKACRLLRFLPDDKTYLATITLGIVTDTDDMEGKVLEQNHTARTDPPDQELVARTLLTFKGDIAQIPPYYSAIHVEGKRLYEMARQGLAPPELKPRPVTIHNIELINYDPPELIIRVHCSKGTYIRSIARDLGSRLGLGGTLSGLVRERSGKFHLAESCSLTDPALLDRAMPVEQAIDLPRLVLPAEIARRLTMGQKISMSDAGGARRDSEESRSGAGADGEAAGAGSDRKSKGEAAETGEAVAESQFFLVVSAGTGRAFCIARPGKAEGEGEKFLAPEVVFADA